MAVLNNNEKKTATVICTIGKDFQTGDFKVTTKVVLPSANGNSYGKGYDSIYITSSNELPFDRLQVLAEYKDMVGHLEDKGGIKFKDCPAEFLYAKAKGEDRWYYCIKAELGTEELPTPRYFYLKPNHELIIKKRGLDKMFTKVETEIEDSPESEE